MWARRCLGTRTRASSLEGTSSVALRTLSLCAGYGGLDLGLKLAGVDARTVCYVEREAFCAELLATRIEDQALDDAPIWSDLGTFDGAAWRGCVDLVVGGFPCQEVSVAGARKAQDGERWLWGEFARVICEVRPRLVFLENVPGLLSAGVEDPATGLVHRAIGDVLGDLAELGFDAEWGVLGADDVGAPHRRKRWWCLAYAAHNGHEWTGGARQRWDGSADDCGSLADADRRGLEVNGRSKLLDGERAAFGNDVDGCYPSAWPPGPADDWRDIPEHLWPATAQPSVRGVADGRASRVDRLRALGNGVVPQCAAAAITALAARAGVELA